eukprot:4990408-Amphidinium_carterae.1
MLGLPSWTCLDVPQTPEGQSAYRLVAYSFGPPPCVPPTEYTTAETTTHVVLDDVDMGGGTEDVGHTVGSARLSALVVIVSLTYIGQEYSRVHG